MSDARLRELERRWKETGTADDEAAYLLERVRSGELTLDRVRIAAQCGSEAARLALGLGRDEAEGADQWLAGLGQAQDLDAYLVACFCVLDAIRLKAPEAVARLEEGRALVEEWLTTRRRSRIDGLIDVATEDRLSTEAFNVQQRLRDLEGTMSYMSPWTPAVNAASESVSLAVRLLSAAWETRRTGRPLEESPMNSFGPDSWASASNELRARIEQVASSSGEGPLDAIRLITARAASLATTAKVRESLDRRCKASVAKWLIYAEVPERLTEGR